MSNRDLAELVRKYVEADRAIFAANHRADDAMQEAGGEAACPAGMTPCQWERQLQDECGVPAARKVSRRYERRLATMMDEQGLHFVSTDRYLVIRDARELPRPFFYYDRYDGRQTAPG